MHKVTVFHNISTDGEGRHPAWHFGYTPGDALVPVREAYTVTDQGSDWHRLANAFYDTMQGDNPFERVDTRYFDEGNRSLCVGDVILFTEEGPDGSWNGTQHWLAVARSGFKEIDPPRTICFASCHGTAALDPDHHPVLGVTGL